MKWLIGIIAVILLLTACSEQIVDEPVMVSQTEESKVVRVDLRLIDNEFDPNTITVNKGDTVRLNFLTADPFKFVMTNYVGGEWVNANTYLEFVADTQGTFDYSAETCHDPTNCNSIRLGVLRVI